jgi:hypothetical protein
MITLRKNLRLKCSFDIPASVWPPKMELKIQSPHMPMRLKAQGTITS